MVRAVYQTFWAAMARGDFLTDARRDRRTGFERAFKEKGASRVRRRPRRIVADIGAGGNRHHRHLSGTCHILAAGGSAVFRPDDQLYLAIAQVTQNDLRSKLRLAGVTRYDQVSAVVMEVTGVVSVLVNGPDDPPMDPALFASVRGRHLLFPEHESSD